VALSREYILQLIQDKGLIEQEELDSLKGQIVQKGTDEDQNQAIVDFLIEKGRISWAQITQLLAEDFDMRIVDLRNIRVSEEALQKLGYEKAIRYRIFPLNIKGNSLELVISNPLDTESIDNLSHSLGMSLELYLASEENIEHVIKQYYGSTNRSEFFAFQELEEDNVDIQIKGLLTGKEKDIDQEEAPTIRLVHLIITEAIKRRASDIHFEPLGKSFRVRYRIDGVLMEVKSPPKRLQLSIINRLKLMASLDISEKRLPQDGRICIKAGNKELDLRVSSLPTAHGESIVLRILDKEGLLLGFPQLGFSSDDQECVEEIITMPDGIFLVTGPTGSGKSTTLYACLNKINQPDRKIITVEDPVEYQMKGINQVQVQKEVGMDFAAALRAILRQSPNIIMVGEIRDRETAEIAINASLTGHMVFSTLHTNDAPSAVARLIDIGVKPFLVSASLRAAMAQRLVRVICQHCKEEYNPTAVQLHSLGITDEQAARANFMIGKGCDQCIGCGFRDRSGIFEIFVIDDELRSMIYGHVTLMQLRHKAKELGMRTMREDGIRKVIAGITTISEVIAVTVE
jgi:type IV pilus assembly protein PilB